MEGRERVIKAVTFDGPDRVPIMHSSLRWAGPNQRRTELEKLLSLFPEDYSFSPYHGYLEKDLRSQREHTEISGERSGRTLEETSSGKLNFTPWRIGRLSTPMSFQIL